MATKSSATMKRAVLFSLTMSMAALALPSQQPAAEMLGNTPVQKLDEKAGMHAPKAIHLGDIKHYPLEAVKDHRSGKCAVSLVVDLEGKPQNLRIIRCTDPVFAQPSLERASENIFTPATMPDGSPVTVRISVEMNFHTQGGQDPSDPIRLGFGSPPRTTSATPDTAGIYPLTKTLTPPRLKSFSDQGYGRSAFSIEGTSPCDVLLTIDAKGKASDPSVVHCDNDRLDDAATKSLLASKYRAAELNGKGVSTRVLAHLEYGNFSASD